MQTTSMQACREWNLETGRRARPSSVLDAGRMFDNSCAQRDNLFYPSYCFALPTLILQTPQAVLESILWSSIVYWVAGLAPEAGRHVLASRGLHAHHCFWPDEPLGPAARICLWDPHLVSKQALAVPEPEIHYRTASSQIARRVHLVPSPSQPPTEALLKLALTLVPCALRRFFTFLLLMFLIHQMAVALFRSIGAIARNMVLANASA